jgi:hypothetical protein
LVFQLFMIHDSRLDPVLRLQSRAALTDVFATASGLYLDNDSGCFTSPHHDALNPQITEAVVPTIEVVLIDN